MQEFTEDALDAYDDREAGFGPELMREIERFVILQVVDTRWREHLESMDYLREGVHLRAMAQKDPLVEYRGEGHIMFEELSKIIREEVVATLFHVEIQQDEAEQALAPVEAPQMLSYEHETATGADAIAAAGGLATVATMEPSSTRSSRTRSATSAATTLLVRLGQEVQALPRGVSRCRRWPASAGRRVAPASLR